MPKPLANALCGPLLPTDLAAVNAVFGKRDALLAQNDTAAIALFEHHASALRAAMGAPGDRLGHEIGRFEFGAAR